MRGIVLAVDGWGQRTAPHKGMRIRPVPSCARRAYLLSKGEPCSIIPAPVSYTHLQEAGGDHIDPSIILIHAEDQLMSAETFKILAGKFIDLAKKNA